MVRGGPGTEVPVPPARSWGITPMSRTARGRSGQSRVPPLGEHGEAVLETANHVRVRLNSPLQPLEEAEVRDADRPESQELALLVGHLLVHLDEAVLDGYQMLARLVVHPVLADERVEDPSTGASGRRGKGRQRAGGCKHVSIHKSTKENKKNSRGGPGDEGTMNGLPSS